MVFNGLFEAKREFWCIIPDMKESLENGSSWKPIGTREEVERFANGSVIKQDLYCGTVYEDYKNLCEVGWEFKHSWYEKDEAHKKGNAVFLFADRRDAVDWATSLRTPTDEKGVVFSVKANVSELALLEPGQAEIMVLFGTKSLAMQLKDKGYDSARFAWTGRYGDEVMVLNPQQVMIVQGSEEIVT